MKCDEIEQTQKSVRWSLHKTCCWLKPYSFGDISVPPLYNDHITQPYVTHSKTKSAQHTSEFKLMSVNSGRLWYNGLHCRHQEDPLSSQLMSRTTGWVSLRIRHAVALRPTKRPNILVLLSDISSTSLAKTKR